MLQVELGVASYFVKYEIFREIAKHICKPVSTLYLKEEI